MLRYFLKIIVLLLVSDLVSAQNTGLKAGDKAPPLVLLSPNGVQQSVNFPYMNKIVLVHFWSSSVNRSKQMIVRALDLHERYSSTSYRNTDGFEVITVAVQSDKGAWLQDISSLKMNNLMNTIAPKGYNDMYIKGYKVSQLPVPLLIDETGTIVLVNPTQLQIEDILDSKKNSPVNSKDLKGKFLYSESSTEIAKNHKLYLLNKHGDTISRTVTDDMGNFTFFGVKHLNEYIFRGDTTNLPPNNPKSAISLSSGVMLGNLERSPGKFDYLLTIPEINKLSGVKEASSTGSKNAISFNANIAFKKGTSDLESVSFTELDKVAALMTKNKDFTLEVISHTDSQGDDANNLELSKKRSSAVKNYLQSKNIAAARIKSIGKGETELKNKCKNKVPCSDEEHAENVRTELKFYK